MFWVGGEPSKTVGPTLRGAAMAPHTPGGTQSVRVGGEPRKTAGPTLRGAAMEPYTPGGTKSVLRLAVSPDKPWVPHREERSGAVHSGRDHKCVAAFNLEKVGLRVLAKIKLIRAEQLAGLMPSTWFQHKESLSTSVLSFSCLENRSFQDCEGMPRFHPHEQVF